MYERVERVEFMADDHEIRLKELEVSTAVISREMSDIKNVQLQTQNTLLEGNLKQNDLLNQIITQTFGLKQTNSMGFWKTFGAAVGSGGLLVVAIVGILAIVQKFA